MKEVIRMIYDTGLIVGRFQTFHKGHQSLVETALKLCDRVIILVGSAQESGTERNPFNVATRMNVIRECYPDKDRVQIYALPDLTNENDITTDWGRFVLDNVDRYIYKVPEIMIYGNDEARSRWFDLNDIKDTGEFIIPRSRLPISATMLREMMVKDERREWMKWVDPKLHKMYDSLRAELLSVPFYDKMKTDLSNN
jgi:nicotinamide-nucleotide adenylyltransferase